MSFTPRDLSREQADLYLAHTEATRELRLTELAHWMAASRGPIGEMDGSVASVQTLWEWSIRFIDSRAVKMIPRNQLTDHDIMFGETSAVAHRRRFYVAQAAPIYILEVLRRLDPTTHLSIEVGDAAHNNFQKLVYRSKSQLETAPQVSDVVYGSNWATSSAGFFHRRRSRVGSRSPSRTGRSWQMVALAVSRFLPRWRHGH